MLNETGVDKLSPMFLLFPESQPPVIPYRNPIAFDILFLKNNVAAGRSLTISYFLVKSPVELNPPTPIPISVNWARLLFEIGNRKEMIKNTLNEKRNVE